VKKLIFRSLFTLALLILLDLGGFVPRAPVCSGLHSSPSVQESSRFSSWLRFCGEASLRVDFLVSHLARVVLIFYREFWFPSWLSLPGALRASTDSRSQIFGSFDSAARFDSSQRRARPEISTPACPAQEVPHRAQFPLPISISVLFLPPGLEFASAPARLASSLSTPVLLLSVSSVFGLASAAEAVSPCAGWIGFPSPDFAEFVLPRAAVDR
jgi:hypothetical protein